MAHLNRFLLGIVLYFSVSFFLFAQSNTYIVFFKDKFGTSGTLSKPEYYLSPRSIEKKLSQSIQIDSTDLPVSSIYLNALLTTGAKIKYTSKWMNAACIIASPTTYNKIMLLPFIQNISSNFRTSNKKNTQEIQNSQQYNYAQPYIDFLGVDYMHSKGIKGKDVMIALTDSGFPGVDTLSAFKHLWNNNQLIYYYDIADNNSNVFNDDSHGTCMLSILAGSTPNYFGIVPEALYVLLRTEVAATESVLEEYNWLRAAEIADSCGVDIISVSLSYTTYDQESDSYTYSDMDGKTSVIARAVDFAYNKGIIVVCSAGNDGEKNWKYIGTPADSKNVLAVGSVNTDKIKSKFSSFGPTADGRIKPDVCTLGESIFCFNPDGTLFSTGGTSLATPMIAGMLAGMKEAFPNLTNDQLKHMLLRSCDHYTNPNNLIGYGIPYFPNTYSIASICNLKSTFSLSPNPYLDGKFILKVPTIKEDYQITIFDNQGKLVISSHFIVEDNLIDLQDLVLTFSPGLYFISIHSNNITETLKWVKL